MPGAFRSLLAVLLPVLSFSARFFPMEGLMTALMPSNLALHIARALALSQPLSQP